MGEKQEDQGEVDMDTSEITFDNLTILKEFSNIANLVRNEDFLEMVPKAKLSRVKWDLMFNCLKQGILDEMVQELSSMWKYENMAQKIEVLEKQKEKFEDLNLHTIVWRPQLSDVKAQLKASDVTNLQKQKKLLESLAKEYESRVTRLKQTLPAKRGYVKALQLDIQKCHKKNEHFITKINEKIENHNNLTKIMNPHKINFEEMRWSDADLELEENTDDTSIITIN